MSYARAVATPDQHFVGGDSSDGGGNGITGCVNKY